VPLVMCLLPNCRSRPGRVGVGPGLPPGPRPQRRVGRD
jgi:hypothetical protein